MDLGLNTDDSVAGMESRDAAGDIGADQAPYYKAAYWRNGSDGGADRASEQSAGAVALLVQQVSLASRNGGGDSYAQPAWSVICLHAIVDLEDEVDNAIVVLTGCS